jgi:hypothetical protein
VTEQSDRYPSAQLQLQSHRKTRFHSSTNSLPLKRRSCSPRRSGARFDPKDRYDDMKCSCKFLLLIFVLVGLVTSCSEPPNPRMAELQRYYALKGDGINPPVKSVALKTTGQAGTIPDSKTAPVLSTTNAPLSTTNNVPALSTTNVPALSTPNPPALYSTNAPATLAPSTNAPAVP